MKSSINSVGRSPLKSARIGMVLALFLALSLFIPTVCQAVSYSLANFLILVDDQLIIKGPADINCCQGASVPARSDLGSRNSIILGGSKTTDVPVGAPVVKDVAVIAPNVTLKSFAAVSMVMFDQVSGSYTVSGTSITQPLPGNLFNDLGNNPLNNTGNPALPVFPSFPTITVGTTDVVVPQSGSVNLVPGNYRDLIIGAYATVNFTQKGIYQFRRVIANTASRYQLLMGADGVQINVNDFVHLAEFGSINPTFRQELTWYVAGFDGTYAGANKNQNGVKRAAGTSPAAFEFDGDGSFLACFVFVKNGTINLRGMSNHPFAAQWFGNSLQQISSLGMVLQQPGEVCFTVTNPCL